MGGAIHDDRIATTYAFRDLRDTHAGLAFGRDGLHQRRR
jgi:hypothetical protein